MAGSGKQAVLVVSFGTSFRETCEKNIGAIEAAIGAAFPSWVVRRAFTSGMIIRKLRQRDGVQVDTVGEALEKLAAEGFRQVLCQPTHIINGEEYDDIVEAAGPYRERFEALVMGAPLLTDTADYRDLVEAVAGALAPAPGKALCLMGHGTTHFADAAYAALDYHFKDRGYPNVFVGTVEGFPDEEALLRRVRDYRPDGVVLTPLMVVAGDHAVNDMAGDGPDSWKRSFAAAGFPVECVLRGLGEYGAVRDIYVRHAREAAVQAGLVAL